MKNIIIYLLGGISGMFLMASLSLSKKDKK